MKPLQHSLNQKVNFPQISHWHGKFQEKNEIKWIDIFFNIVAWENKKLD